MRQKWMLVRTITWV